MLKHMSHKVQAIKDSFAIYLPKKWCKDNRIARGDEISLIHMRDLLVIAPHRKGPKDEKTIKIFITGLSSKELEVFLYSSYIDGFDVLEITKDDFIRLEERYLIKSIIKKMFGMDIVHEDEKTIIVKEVSSLDDFSSLIERSFQLTGLALNYLLTILKGIGRPEMIEDVEEEIDRFFFAVQRKINKIISFRELVPKVSFFEAVHYLDVMRKLERLSDLIKELTYEIKNGTNVPFSSITDIVDYYQKCSEAFNERDLAKLVNIIYMRHFICEKMLNLIDDRVVLTHLTRIADNIADIARIMINLIIGMKERVDITYPK